MTDSFFKNVDFDGDGGPLVPSDQVLRPGKKNTRYDEDPEILARLARVAAMMLKGFKAHEIASELDYPLGSAKRDIARVKTIWRKEAREAIKAQKDAALAQYKLAITKAWERIEALPEFTHRYLPIIIQAQERIDRLTGANAPEVVEERRDVTLTVKDIETVRQERWLQVREALGAIGEVG